MPLDEYICVAGHRVEQIVKLDRSNRPTTCHCGAKLRRVISAPATHFPGADSWRK